MPDSELPSLSPAAARVLRQLVINGAASRTELARAVGLTPGAVTRAVQPLLERGVLSETHRVPVADTSRSVGRPQTAIGVRPGRLQQIGIKITDSRLIAVVCDLRCVVVADREVELDDHDPQSVIEQIALLCEDLQQDHRHIGGVGLAVSGDVDRTSGQIGYSPFLNWRDVQLRDQVKVLTGLPVVIENDVRALLTGERWYGLGVGASSLAMITVGTGIGSALLVHDNVVRGSHGVAGEVAHVLVDPQGPGCHCGNRGCVEAYASTAAILAGMQQAGVECRTIAEVADLARNGQQDAVRVLAQAGQAIGVGIATVANLFGPARMIITGEAIGADDGYSVMEPQVRKAFARRAFGSAGDCELELRPLRFADWARGAAACAIEELISPRRAG